MKALLSLTVLFLTCLALGETLRLECEDFAGPWREQTNIQGYSGRGFVVSNAAGIATTMMTRRVAIPTAAVYHVWARGW